jgi:hypothetical protein
MQYTPMSYKLPPRRFFLFCVQPRSYGERAGGTVLLADDSKVIRGSFVATD